MAIDRENEMRKLHASGKSGNYEQKTLEEKKNEKEKKKGPTNVYCVDVFTI
jgi:hypothetical protein